jgi:hypothetical protein
MIEEVISKKELWAEFDKVFNPHDKNDKYVHVIITFWQESIENISVFDSLQLAERHIDFLPEGFERDIGDHETYQEMEGTGYRHFVVQMNDTDEQQGATQ